MRLIVVFFKPKFALLPLILLAIIPLRGQSVRDHTRMNMRGTKVSGSQAADLTLTLSPVAQRPIQQVIRTGGTIDKTHKVITVSVGKAEAGLVQVGQRVRSFPPESKQSMYQAKVTRVVSKDGRAVVEVTLSGQGIEGRANYVVEIIVERGEFLCIPSEAIIEEGDQRVAYVQQKDGSYVPRTIEPGFQGELYTQILGGLETGEQVVTFGSFFIDSEYKLKLAGQGGNR